MEPQPNFSLSPSELQEFKTKFEGVVRPYLSKLREEERMYGAHKAFLEQIVPALEAAMKLLENAQNQLIAEEQKLAKVKALTVEAEAVYAPLKERNSEEERKEKVLKAERVRDHAEYERQKEAEQQILTALEGAISERGTEFGTLIAKELSLKRP